MTIRPRDLVVRVGCQHNRWVVVLRDYDGLYAINTQLLDALQKQIGIKVTELDYIEILGGHECL